MADYYAVIPATKGGDSSLSARDRAAAGRRQRAGKTGDRDSSFTNQRSKAVELLEEIIKQHPEKYQPYDLLAQVLDDQARSLQRDNRLEEAKAKFAKVGRELRAEPADQSRSCRHIHLRLAELLLGPLKDPERAVKFLAKPGGGFRARRRSFIILPSLCAKRNKLSEAVATFEEALHEAQLDEDDEIETRNSISITA